MQPNGKAIVFFCLPFLLLAACSAARLAPDQVAARITLRPVWLELTPARSGGSALLRASMQVCNGNDFDLTLVEAPWVGSILGTPFGKGRVIGPARLPADKCSELLIDGSVALAEQAVRFAESLLLGQPLEPEVEVDAVVQVYGVPVHRKVRLVGFGLRVGVVR